MDNEEINNIEKEKKKNVEVKLKSSMYNHDNEKIEKREDNNSNSMIWGFAIGFILFLALVVMIIFFTH